MFLEKYHLHDLPSHEPPTTSESSPTHSTWKARLVLPKPNLSKVDI